VTLRRSWAYFSARSDQNFFQKGEMLQGYSISTSRNSMGGEKAAASLDERVPRNNKLNKSARK
jgi:hypothetical protein